tara:strand:- start:1568 stop:1741 length:174 start_codon:yes stop_codon:yes gene_type:complete
MAEKVASGVLYQEKNTKALRKVKRPMEPRVEEGLTKALKAQGITREEFNKQFQRKKK